MIEKNKLTRRVVTRFVAGEEVPAAVDATRELHRRGFTTTLDCLGEDVVDLAGARHIRDQYLSLLFELHQAGEAEGSEVSVKLTALGQSLPGNGHDIALAHAKEICVAADSVGCRVTLDMEDYTTVDSTLEIGDKLRTDFPFVGNVLQANLRRTESDLRRLAGSGARIRLVKGAYREPKNVAFQKKVEVDHAYERGIRILMSSSCYPMIATHDPAMVRASVTVAREVGRPASDWEVQMLYGIAGQLQQEVVTVGIQLRIYVPFGTDWYGYFMRRLAERPANVAFFLRALVKG